LPAPFEEEAPAVIDATAVVTKGAAKPGPVPALVEGEEKSIEEKASLLAERETRENRVFILG
jgi:chromosome segregation ATPase